MLIIIKKIMSLINQIIKKNRRLLKWLVKIFCRLNNYSYHKVSEYAGYLENDIHPKHRITNYHQFFIDHIKPGDSILDLGCGNGYLSYDLAKKARKVVGIDHQRYLIESAKANYKSDNLEFIIGDINTYNFKNKFDKIVLSNVLEHIEDRVNFLKRIYDLSDIILLRVPMEDRDWLTIYKKNNNLEYRLDETHFIEYRLDSLKPELEAAGCVLLSYQINWGELWGVVGKKYYGQK